MKPPSVHKVKEIVNGLQVWKFCFYTFFRQLSFFESFLYLVLLNWGLSLSQIGLLTSIQQCTIYLSEIPSGIISDNYGGKQALLLCFTFYILSFACYGVLSLFTMQSDSSNGTLSTIFWCLLIIANIFNGLGDAFRSGSHKSLIYAWIDINHYNQHKTEIYGNIRSFGLLGSSISSIISLFILAFFGSNSGVIAIDNAATDHNDYQILFWASIVPLILDFLLIMSYEPFDLINANLKKEKIKNSINSSDGTKGDVNINTNEDSNSNEKTKKIKDSNVCSKDSKTDKTFVEKLVQPFKEIYHQFRHNLVLLLLLINSTMFDATFKSIQHFIQPVIVTYFGNIKNNSAWMDFLGFGDLFSNISNKEIILAVIYCLFYLFSSISSKRAFIFVNVFGNKDNKKSIHLLFDFLAILFLMIGVCIWGGFYWMILIAYLLIYVTYNVRRTVMLSVLTDVIRKDQRATILSVESLLRSMLVALFAPFCGFIGDALGLNVLFFVLAAFVFVVNFVFRKQN